MKEYLKTLAIALGTMLFIFVILEMTGLTLGDNTHDFGKQHVKFIEYIRNIIFSTGDLKQQITMNYGLGQSFVALYYHGMYNPYVMFSLILGSSVSIKFVMYFIYLLIIGLTSLSMHWLVRLNNFSEYEARIISLLTTFSGAVIFHLSWHPMFIYYYPFMILSLVSLHKMVKGENPYFYSLMFGMVFYTNFFFAPVVSIIQFLYFMGLVYDENKPVKGNILKFLKAYSIGVLFGALFLIPVFFFAKQGVRGVNENLMTSVFNNYDDLMVNILDYKYVSGIGIVPLLATLYGLTLHKKKHLQFPILFLCFIFLFNKIVLLLNLNMYEEFKFFSNFIPLLWLIIGNLIFKERNNLKKIMPLMLSTFLLVMVGHNEIEYLVKTLLFFELVLIYAMSFANENKHLQSFGTLAIVALTISTSVIITPDELYLNSTLNFNLKNEQIDLKQETKLEPYRTGPKGINSLENLKMLSPNIYTSLENGNFEKMINSYLELENADPSRYHRNTIFENYFMRNYLGIKTDKTGKKTATINPIAYGISNEYLYDIELLKKMSPDERLLAVNQGKFIDGGKSNYENKIRPEIIYFSDKSFTFKKGQTKKVISVPKDYQKPGVLRITADTNLTEDSVQTEDIILNDHFNIARMNDYYGKADNKRITFLFDSSESLKELNLEVNTSENKGKPIIYNNLQVEFFPQEKLVDNKYPIYKPEKFIVDMGHSYTFEVDQKTKGYLVTSIPYDNGFTIEIDDEQVKTEKIDGVFLGAKLDSGKHMIKISYKIKYFNLSMLLTIISIFIMGLGTFKYRKKKR